MTDLILDVGELHAGYGRAEVLHGLNLKARTGQVITVIGPNGAGKSTLLNALMGVLPASGTIEYHGQPINPLSLEERVMQGIALVPETRALFGTMPVEDNLLLGAYRQVRGGQQEQPAGARRGLHAVPAAEGAAHAARRHAVGRRAADARGGARADEQAVAADARRAEPRPGAAGRARDLRDHRQPARDRRDDPAGRAERARRARGRRLRLRARDGRDRARGRGRRPRRRPRVIDTYLGAARAAASA